MLGGKSSYARSIRVLWRTAARNKAIKSYLRNAKLRYLKHKAEMRPVNLDKLIRKYAPGSSSYVQNYKIKYANPNLPYIVVADPSGYARILDSRTNTYVDAYTGETLNSNVPNYNKRTHFRILRRDEL